MRRLIGVTVLTAALLPLAAPAGANARPDYATQCQFELKPKGYYSYAAGQTVPVVRPGEGGTQAEADALNACIRAKAAAGEKTSGTMSSPIRESSPAPVGAAPASATPKYTKKRRGAPVLSGGSGYRGSYLEGGSGSVALTAAPEAPRKTRKVPRGLTPLPSGYPLMPGDEDLWYSLTPAQQRRAIQFLEDGSTIRSSLEPN